MSHFVIGTAGHIDHGKTSLVKALTGTDTDKLKEEKERNITIDIGFAFMGDEITIIDVPGHEKFIKNMVAGVSTIDFVLFVIAADDGIMPQTKEHLDILRLLQIQDGAIILTKADMVEEDWLELVSEEISDYMKDSFLENAPIIVVDSLSGRGIEEVKKTILDRKKHKQERVDKGIFRLPVDRIFSIKGHGTIITGTILSGSIKEGDNLTIQPAGKEVRVKGIQCHGEKKKSLNVGNRAAINIHGVTTSEISRGDILVTPGYLQPTYMFDSKFYLLKNSKELENRTRVRVHAGTKEVFGRIIILDKESIKAGEEAYIQIRLEEEMNLSPGERYVVRTYSPQFTIGGGSIIRTSIKKSKRFDKENIKLLQELEKGDPEEVVEEILLQNKLIPLSTGDLAKKLAKTSDELKQLLKILLQKKTIISIGSGKNSLYFHGINVSLIENNIISNLDKFHEQNPYRAGISKAEIRTKISKNFNQNLFDYILKEMDMDEKIAISLNTVSKNGFEITLTKELEKEIANIINLYKEMGFRPVSFSNMAEKLDIEERELKELTGILLTKNKLVKISEDIFIEKELFVDAKNKIANTIRKNGSIKLGEISELLNSSRKYMLPLAEFLDRNKFTVRQGDTRVLYDM